MQNSVYTFIITVSDTSCGIMIIITITIIWIYYCLSFHDKLFFFIFPPQSGQRPCVMPPAPVLISPASRRSPRRGRAAAGWRTAGAAPPPSPGTTPYLQHTTRSVCQTWTHLVCVCVWKVGWRQTKLCPHMLRRQERQLFLHLSADNTSCCSSVLTLCPVNGPVVEAGSWNGFADCCPRLLLLLLRPHSAPSNWLLNDELILFPTIDRHWMMSPPANQRLARETHHRCEMEQKQAAQKQAAQKVDLSAHEQKKTVAMVQLRNFIQMLTAGLQPVRSGFKRCHLCSVFLQAADKPLLLPSSANNPVTLMINPSEFRLRYHKPVHKYIWICSTDRRVCGSWSGPFFKRGPVETEPLLPQILCAGVWRTFSQSSESIQSAVWSTEWMSKPLVKNEDVITREGWGSADRDTEEGRHVGKQCFYTFNNDKCTALYFPSVGWCVWLQLLENSNGRNNIINISTVTLHPAIQIIHNHNVWCELKVPHMFSHKLSTSHLLSQDWPVNLCPRPR